MVDTTTDNTLAAVLQELEKQIEAAGSAVTYADSLGVSESFVSQIRRGHKLPNGKVLKALGFSKSKVTAITYQKSTL